MENCLAQSVIDYSFAYFWPDLQLAAVGRNIEFLTVAPDGIDCFCQFMVNVSVSITTVYWNLLQRQLLFYFFVYALLLS